MTPEEIQLLLKDLCARLPYGVKCRMLKSDSQVCTLDSGLLDKVEILEPYLRPMSSMTEEEEQDYASLSNHCISTSIGFAYLEAQVLVEWLNFHHFDFRNLIEMGLALEAPEGMYKTE